MAHETQELVRAYAHCVQSRCPGNAQEEVDAKLVTTSYAYVDTGGDNMFSHPERTIERLVFADPEESHCRCGSPRDLSTQKRRQYDGSISGYDPKGLLDIEPFDPNKQKELMAQPPSDRERERYEGQINDLQKQNQEISERFARLEGLIMGQQMAQPVETLVEEPLPAAPEGPADPELEARRAEAQAQADQRTRDLAGATPTIDLEKLGIE